MFRFLGVGGGGCTNVKVEQAVSNYRFDSIADSPYFAL